MNAYEALYNRIKWTLLDLRRKLVIATFVIVGQALLFIAVLAHDWILRQEIVRLQAQLQAMSQTRAIDTFVTPNIRTRRSAVQVTENGVVIPRYSREVPMVSRMQ